jgi:maltooligosyltrehalose trehalohydrolase
VNYQQCHKDGCTFRVWAPEKKNMELWLAGRDTGLPMQKDGKGYFVLDVPGIGAGQRYLYSPDGGPLYPDPASAYQPQGIYAASCVVDHAAFSWTDGSWKGRPLAESIIYEIHVGTFTPEGTFEAIIPRLDALSVLGVNALELMPVAAFSGERNWGYDGAFLYAVFAGYGGPKGLKRLVDACHRRGIAVFLDVVYNHIGKEGNYLEAYGPYFSDKYHTPWGKAINYDGAWSDGVREFIVGNALYWAEQYHMDGLRLDAVHEIFDRNAVTIWDELYGAVRDWEARSGRRCWLIAESDGNDPRVVRRPDQGGRGFDAQWMDDFHHSLYVLIDPAGSKHYQDFGPIEQLAKAWVEGFVHSGEYVRFRYRHHGASSAGIGGEHFVVFNQNHDLPGNRPGGERLSALVGLPALKLAAAAVLLSPYIPLLFMGEEYGEDAPFYFFSDYQEPATIQTLIDSRRQQFAVFNFEGKSCDPQSAATFLQSKLHWALRGQGVHRLLLDWYQDLIRLRRMHPLLADHSKRRLRADVVGEKGLVVYRYSADGQRHLVTLFNFSYDLELYAEIGYAAADHGEWRKLLDSAVGPMLPAAVGAGAILRVPPQVVAVYELNLSQGSPAPAAG